MDANALSHWLCLTVSCHQYCRVEEQDQIAVVAVAHCKALDNEACQDVDCQQPNTEQHSDPMLARVRKRLDEGGQSPPLAQRPRPTTPNGTPWKSKALKGPGRQCWAPLPLYLVGAPMECVGVDILGIPHEGRETLHTHS